MQSKIEIRNAVRDDLEVLVRFNVAMASESENRHLPLRTVRKGVLAVLNNPEYGFYLVAEINRKVAGSLMVTTEWSDWRNRVFWWIQSVYVSLEFRHHGIYRTLYNAVKQRARRSAKVCGCRLYVERKNRIAQEVYKRSGMTESNYRIFEELF